MQDKQENKDIKRDEEQNQAETSDTKENQQATEELSSEDDSDNGIELSNIFNSDIEAAGRDIIKIGKVVTILQNDLKELARVRDIPPPAPLDVSSQEKVNQWFAHKHTSDRDKFFAITLSIFDGLKYPDFRDVYEIILHVMDVTDIEEEKKSHSLFDVADDELLESLGVEIVHTNDGLEEIIRFKQETYATAIFDLMRRRYRSIFLDLLLALKQIVEKHHYWEIRYRAAMAVAEIGKLGFYRMRSQVLESWARDKHSYVRAAVGYPLAQLAKDKNYRASVKQLLVDWISNNSTDARYYRWTVASVYKQIGLIKEDWAREWVYDGLKKIASFSNVSDSVAHTLVVLSLQGQLENILYELKHWVEQKDGSDENEEPIQNQYVVAILTLWLLSAIYIELANKQEEVSEIGPEDNNLFDLVQRSETQKGVVWQLIVAAGGRAFKLDQIYQFFTLVEYWNNYSIQNSRWKDTLGNLLVDIFVATKLPRDREHFWNILNLWQRQKDDPELVKLAIMAKAKIKERIL